MTTVADTSRPAPAGELADAVIALGEAALAFGRIDRTAVYHPDGMTPESDSDHTVMLGWIACMPKIVHLLDGAVGLAELRIGRAELRALEADQRAHYAAEFDAVLALHAELVARVVTLPAVADPPADPPVARNAGAALAAARPGLVRLS